MRAAATIMPASRHRAARGLRRRCAMPGVARDTPRQYTQRTTPYVAALVRTLPLTLTVRLTTFQHASRRFTFGRPRRLYINLGCVFRIFCSLCAPPARRHVRSPPLGREPPARRSHQTQPSGSANRGFKPRTGDITQAITQARGGGAPPRRRGAQPPAMRPRSLLRVRISQTSSAPCNEPRASRPLSLVDCPPMAALRGLSADLGIPPSELQARLHLSARAPSELQASSSARLGSCRRWHCTGRWHCSPLALH